MSRTEAGHHDEKYTRKLMRRSDRAEQEVEASINELPQQEYLA
jgi:hypothetical protein